MPSFCFPPIARIGIQTTKKSSCHRHSTTLQSQLFRTWAPPFKIQDCKDCSSTKVCQPDRQHRCKTKPQIPQERRIHRLQRPWGHWRTLLSEPAHAKSATCGATAPHTPLVAQPLNPAEPAKPMLLHATAAEPLVKPLRHTGAQAWA